MPQPTLLPNSYFPVWVFYSTTNSVHRPNLPKVDKNHESQCFEHELYEGVSLSWFFLYIYNHCDIYFHNYILIMNSCNWRLSWSCSAKLGTIKRKYLSSHPLIVSSPFKDDCQWQLKSVNGANGNLYSNSSVSHIKLKNINIDLSA